MQDLWKSLKDDLLSVADKSCRWTKGPLRHQVTWWWNKDVDQAIKRKQQLWKGGHKEPYLQAKKDSKRAGYMTKKNAEEEKFSNINRENSRKEVFTIAKQMKPENCDGVGDKCVMNDKGEAY